MEAIRVWSDEEIEKLCNEVCGQLIKTSSSESSNTISLLRHICGKKECGCGNFTPYQNLSNLFRIKCNSNSFPDYSVGILIMKNYNNLVYEKYYQSALEQILKYSLTAPHSESRNQFLARLWTFPKLRNFTINLMEDFLQNMSKNIEDDILNIFEKSMKKLVKDECIWKDAKFERIVFWCSNSAKIFCFVTSVLNACLQWVVDQTKEYETSVSVVNQFIDSVKVKCLQNNRDFAHLYPREYYSLVSLMDINPKCFPQNSTEGALVTLTTVVELVNQSLKAKPIQTLCILTHFPDWAPYIS